MSTQQEDFYTDLISIVAHDLKTPISAVKGFIELVQQAGPLNDQQQHFSDRALLSLQRMERLVADLLEYTRLNSATRFDLVACDVGVLIREAVELLEANAARRDIAIQVTIDATNAVVMADARLMSQVIHNLIGNAVKYNQDGGLVSVRVSDAPGELRVDVKDTGVGIQPDDVGRVFERFYRAKGNAGTKVEGSGLGLAIAQTVVRKHGGRIWVESVQGEGSTFSFTLPRPASAQRDRDELAYEVGSEAPDAVDDNMQEAREMPDTDSHSDVV